MIKNGGLVFCQDHRSLEKYLLEHVEKADTCVVHRDVYSKYIDSEFLRAYQQEFQQEFGGLTPLGSSLKLGDRLFFVHYGGKIAGKFFFLPHEIGAVAKFFYRKEGAYGGLGVGVSRRAYRYDRITYVSLMSLMLFNTASIDAIYSDIIGNKIKSFTQKHFRLLDKRIPEFDKCIKIFT